jgi:hypothetical protein
VALVNTLMLYVFAFDICGTGYGRSSLYSGAAVQAS